MKLLLLPLLFLLTVPVFATVNPCQEVAAELSLAKDYGLITDEEAKRIYLRCKLHQKLSEELAV